MADLKKEQRKPGAAGGDFEFSGLEGERLKKEPEITGEPQIAEIKGDAEGPAKKPLVEPKSGLVPETEGIKIAPQGEVFNPISEKSAPAPAPGEQPVEDSHGARIESIVSAIRGGGRGDHAKEMEGASRHHDKHGEGSDMAA